MSVCVFSGGGGSQEKEQTLQTAPGNRVEGPWREKDVSGRLLLVAPGSGFWRRLAEHFPGVSQLGGF